MNIAEKLKSTIRDVEDFPTPGILFKDITPVLLQPKLCDEVLQEFIAEFSSPPPDAIVAMESRGFMWGMLLAHHFRIPFIPVRKSGKLPFTTISQSYSLEYGTATMEIHTDAIKKGGRVLIHDDLLATGGTAEATANLVEKSGGEVLGFCFLIELSFLRGRERLKKFDKRILSLLTYQ